MNLKEAFRYQNKLQSFLDDAQSILDRDSNVTRGENTYLRHKVMAEAEDEVVLAVPEKDGMVSKRVQLAITTVFRKKCGGFLLALLDFLHIVHLQFSLPVESAPKDTSKNSNFFAIGSLLLSNLLCADSATFAPKYAMALFLLCRLILFLRKHR